MIYGRPSNRQPSKKQPIKWIVLEANENEALLISLYGLDCKEYDNHKDSNDITWENCDLRKWLNDVNNNKITKMITAWALCCSKKQ